MTSVGVIAAVSNTQIGLVSRRLSLVLRYVKGQMKTDHSI